MMTSALYAIGLVVVVCAVLFVVEMLATKVRGR